MFNVSGEATGILLAITIVNAFVAGLFFKGKSGWCSSICPLLPLQRVYGQTPFAVVPNSHCQPCVGCTKNCYDFKPQVAYQADMHDADKSFVSPRRLFAAALPGFVLGFFTLVSHPHLTTAQAYERLALYFLASIASFYILDALIPAASGLLTAIYAAVAINIFYWYARRAGQLVQDHYRSGHPLGQLADPGPRAGPHHLLDRPNVRGRTPVRGGVVGSPCPAPGGQCGGQGPREQGEDQPGRDALRARRHPGRRRDRSQLARGSRTRPSADRGGLPDGRLRR